VVVGDSCNSSHSDFSRSDAMKCPLFIVEVPLWDARTKNEYLGDISNPKYNFGSSPKHEGEVVEGNRVPSGKTWLFPMGGAKAQQTLASHWLGSTTKQFVVEV